MSDDNVVAMPGAKPKLVDSPPNAELIEICERLLEKAKAGDLISIAFVGHQKDHQLRFGHYRPDGMRATEQIGAVTWLGHRITRAFDNAP